MAATTISTTPRDAAQSRAWAVLASAAALGVAGNALFRGVTAGIGLTLWVTLCVIVGAGFWRMAPEPKARQVRWLIAPLLAFAACLAWRDSTTLRLLNVLACLLCVGLIVSRIRTGGLMALTMVQLVAGWLAQLGATLFDAALLLFRDVQWGSLGTPSSRGMMATTLRGLVIAAPVFLVFGVLLSSADAVFANYAARAIDWDFAEVSKSLAVIFATSWIVASVYRRLFVTDESVMSPALWNSALGPGPMYPPPLPKQPQFEVPLTPKLDRLSGIGNVETAIILGSLNLLLGVFVFIQLRFLFFSGAPLPAGVTYAEYARSGFFELLTVVGLAIPVLRLTRHGLERRAASGLTYPLLAATTVGLLLIVGVSALRRTSLYVEAYGLSEIRLYASAAMLWLSGCLILLMATILSRRTQAFVSGATALGLVFLFGLNAANADAVIARANLNHAIAGNELDAVYLTSLSADALPTIVEALPRLKSSQQREVSALLRVRDWRANDWRAANWGTLQAQAILESVK